MSSLRRMDTPRTFMYPDYKCFQEEEEEEEDEDEDEEEEWSDK